MTNKIGWKEGLVLGFVAGVFWGWASIGVNYVTGVFPFELTIVQNLFVGSIGGGVFGTLSGAFLGLIGERIPVKNIILKAVIVSTPIWILFRLTGLLMTEIDESRYNAVISQTIQGFFLSIVLGCILGLIWQWQENRNRQVTK